MNPLKMLSRGGAVSEPSDADFENVTLLLHGDGTNGAQNNTFLDSSTNNFTITRNGNTTQGTFSPFSKVDGRWGNYFDGNGDGLTLPSNSAFVPGTGEFTIEFFCYVPSGNDQLFYDFRSGPSGNTAFNIGRNDSNGFYVFNNSAGVIVSSGAGTATFNTWHHIVVSRVSTTLRLFVNGSQAASATVSTDFSNTQAPRIGMAAFSTDNPLTGYISNFRFVKGSGVTSVTVPTSPLTAISGTSLLTCQSNRFIDNSSNNFAITVNGNTAVTPFSPFPTLTAYDAATNGGSGYFDGSGDYLTAAQNSAFNLGTGAFTVEAYFYLNSLALINRIIGLGNGANGGSPLERTGWSMSAASSFVNFYRYDGSTETNRSASVTITAGQWYHLVACRDGSSNFALFLNGTRVLSQSSATTSYNNINADPLYLGRMDDGAGGFSSKFVNGYIGSTRVVAGSTVYDPTQTTLTVPTAPLTAITNTSLLLNFTNAGIIDHSMSNNLETVGNAQIDTTTKKYGTGSMEFDGSGDYLLLLNNPNLILSGGVYTIEGWIYPNGDYSDYRTIVAKRVAGTTTTAWQVFLNITNGYLGFYNGTIYLSSTTPTANQWSHVAAVYDGTNMNLYLNGTRVLQTAITNSDVTANIFVGWSGTLTEFFNGFIDDLRITKGKARYTSNFTPPTAAFEDIGT